jgi:hypothetical protein
LLLGITNRLFLYIFHAQKGFLKKKVAALCFFSKMGKMGKGPLYGGLFFNINLIIGYLYILGRGGKG